jgi:hypothetical protein
MQFKAGESNVFSISDLLFLTTSCAGSLYSATAILDSCILTELRFLALMERRTLFINILIDCRVEFNFRDLFIHLIARHICLFFGT